LCDEVNDLAWDLAKCQPTTLAGVIAVLRYTSVDNNEGDLWPNMPAEDSDSLYGNEWRSLLLANMATALERVARPA
jgi:hypothetical protein